MVCGEVHFRSILLTLLYMIISDTLIICQYQNLLRLKLFKGVKTEKDTCLIFQKMFRLIKTKKLEEC